MASSRNEWLAGRLVIEIGGRVSSGVCGTMLAQAGATVVFVEPRDGDAPKGKFCSRSLFAAGKRSLAVAAGSAEDEALLKRLLLRADIVLTSTDWDFGGSLPALDIPATATICNFTAMGADYGEQGLSEADVQLLSGVAHTSGFPEGPPVALRVPILEYSAGVYGAAACVAALAAMRDAGQPQRVEVSLFQCALNALLSFLPSVFQGGDPGRLGNGHPMSAPWNAYRARDGWLLFCSASDVHWQRFCALLGRPDLAEDERFMRVADRAHHREEVDSIVSQWTQGYDIATCIRLLSAAGLAGGAVVPVKKLKDEANVRRRGSIITATVPETGRKMDFPQSVLTTRHQNPPPPPVIPIPDADRVWLANAPFESILKSRQAPDAVDRLPLEGIRVVEIGQFTTAPLCARHLAMYGADVMKVEPLSGDAAREWAPMVDGLSLFFALSNSGKTCYKADLKSPEGLDKFKDLIRDADVLVENMRPGSLAALGLDVEALLAINPSLIYCPITGFGNVSAYPNRPAFDTVVQAMSGIMDANAVDGMPLKAGVSVCDFMGGEVALFAILSALHDRRRTGIGTVFDLSMQDIAVWVTASLWEGPAAEEQPMVCCRDGYVRAESLSAGEADRLEGMTREEAVVFLRERGVRAVPVRTVAEALHSLRALELGLVRMEKNRQGNELPQLASPVTMTPTGLRRICLPEATINL